VRLPFWFDPEGKTPPGSFYLPDRLRYSRRFWKRQLRAIALQERFFLTVALAQHQTTRCNKFLEGVCFSPLGGRCFAARLYQRAPRFCSTHPF